MLHILLNTHTHNKSGHPAITAKTVRVAMPAYGVAVGGYFIALSKRLATNC